MKKAILAAAILALCGTTAVYAHSGNNGGGNGGCGVGQTTNGCGGTTGGSVINQGGTGGIGYGGSGGTGIGLGVGYGQGGNASATGGQGGQGGAGGAGGAVLGSGNSANSNSNRNTNKNTNKQGQAQGQAQGQQQRATAKQGQSQSSRNRNDNRSNAANSNSNANSGNNSAQQVNVGGDTYEAARIPVATAYASPLAASNGTCMGSSTAGFQGMAVGVSFGSTWKDDSCDMRYDAEALRQAGMPKAAVARLCQKPEIAAAMAAAGTPCPGSNKIVVATNVAVLNRTPSAAETSHQYTGTDPIVRRRLGLPPLK